MGLVCLSILRKLTKSRSQTEGIGYASRTRLLECEGGGRKPRTSLLLALLICSCGPTKTKRLQNHRLRMNVAGRRPPWQSSDPSLKRLPVVNQHLRPAGVPKPQRWHEPRHEPSNGSIPRCRSIIAQTFVPLMTSSCCSGAAAEFTLPPEEAKLTNLFIALR